MELTENSRLDEKGESFFLVNAIRNKVEWILERIELLCQRYLQSFLIFITILHFCISYGIWSLSFYWVL